MKNLFRDICQSYSEGDYEPIYSLIEHYLLASSEIPYYHDNAFAKFSLQKEGNMAIRLHYWLKNDDICISSNIHNHQWSFKSFILKGELINTTYIESDVSGDPYSKFFYPAGSGINDYVLKFCNSSRLSKKESRIYTCGNMYQQEYSIIHNAANNRKKDSLITLVLAERIDENICVSVFKDVNYQNDIKIISIEVPKKETLNNLLKELEIKI